MKITSKCATIGSIAMAMVIVCGCGSFQSNQTARALEKGERSFGFGYTNGDNHLGKSISLAMFYRIGLGCNTEVEMRWGFSRMAFEYLNSSGVMVDDEAHYNALSCAGKHQFLTENESGIDAAVQVGLHLMGHADGDMIVGYWVGLIFSRPYGKFEPYVSWRWQVSPTVHEFAFFEGADNYSIQHFSQLFLGCSIHMGKKFRLVPEYTYIPRKSIDMLGVAMVFLF